MTRMVSRMERLGRQEVRDSGDAPSYRGPVYLLQCLLFGKGAAQLFARLRAETQANRNRTGRSAGLPHEPAWVATTHDWPTDGTWLPSPDVTRLLTDETFRAAVESLKTSLQSQPISGHGIPQRSLAEDQDGDPIDQDQR